jgi:hypothetical protein
MRRPGTILTVLALALVAAAGCGGAVPQPEHVDLDKVPEPVMATARSRLPGCTFTQVYRKVEDGKDVYELLAKDKQGKIREVEVSPTGEFVRLE